MSSLSCLNESLAWVLRGARAHTLALVADIPSEAMHLQAAPGERHPAWLLGHLLLADTYLLFLLGVEPLADDLPSLLRLYGPASAPATGPACESRDQVVDRLTRAGAARVARVRAMRDRELAEPLPDALLARAQPTLAHHLHGLVYHEGYHAGQLSSWRKAHGFPAVDWTLGPRGTGTV